MSTQDWWLGSIFVAVFFVYPVAMWLLRFRYPYLMRGGRIRRRFEAAAGLRRGTVQDTGAKPEQGQPTCPFFFVAAIGSCRVEVAHYYTMAWGNHLASAARSNFLKAKVVSGCGPRFFVERRTGKIPPVFHDALDARFELTQPNPKHSTPADVQAAVDAWSPRARELLLTLSDSVGRKCLVSSNGKVVNATFSKLRSVASIELAMQLVVELAGGDPGV